MYAQNSTCIERALHIEYCNIDSQLILMQGILQEKYRNQQFIKRK
jgi:hypothetical protein